MAESVVKLRLDSGEYDFKIKRAAQNVLSFGENCQKAGQSVVKADKETLDYVRSIGQMETVAKNTKGKINEMTTAFTELSVQYKNLTDEEKQSPFGQTLSQSLDQLKTRIGESKTQLTEVNAELGNTSRQSDDTGGVLDALAGKFGLNINQAGAFGVALGAATVATKVAKDAFFSNEEQLDEWGRTVAASESVYQGFLDALNTGDISGFLSKISSIISAAREAYDALDMLATYNAFNQINVEKTRHNLSESINDFREGSGSKDKVKSAGDAVISELRTRQKFEQEAYNKAVKDLARQRGVREKDLRDVLTGEWGTYEELKGLGLSGKRRQWMSSGVATTAATGGRYVTLSTAANRREELGAALRRINDEEGIRSLKNIQALGAQVERTNREIDSVNRQVIRTMNARTGIGSSGGGGGRTGGGRSGGGRGGRGGGGGTHQETPEEKAAKLVAAALGNYEDTVSTATLRFEMGMDNSEEQQKKLLAAQERLTMAYADAYNITQDENYKTKFEEEAGKYNNLEDVVRGKRDLFNTATAELAGMSVNPIEGLLDKLLGESMEDYAKRKGFSLDTGNPGGKMPKGWEWGDKAAATLDKWSAPMSQIAGAVEDLGIDVPKGIEKLLTTTQAISTILTGISTMVMVIQFLTTKNSIPIFGKLANGGIVPHAASGLLTGHHFSGDMVPVLLNDGELILNRSQQSTLASGLRNNGMAGMQLEAVIDGEDIRLSFRNGDLRRGRGEYVRSKR